MNNINTLGNEVTYLRRRNAIEQLVARSLMNNINTLGNEVTYNHVLEKKKCNRTVSS